MADGERARAGSIAHLPPGASVAGWPDDTGVVCKAAGATTGGAFALFELTNPPGSGAGPHLHQHEDEALYVLAGTYEIRDVATGGSFTAGAGSYVFLPRGTPHAFTNVGAEDGRLLILAFPAGLEGFFAALAALPADEPDQERAERIASISARFGLRFGLPESPG